jgi:peptide chain release factor 1
MFPSLELKLRRFEELEQMLQSPEVLSNSHKLQEVNREYGGLRKLAESVRTFKKLDQDVTDLESLLNSESDEETRSYAESELVTLRAQHELLKVELEDLVTAGDSITRGGLIMEIRAGTGGDEAALFAGDLYNMYSRYVETRGWSQELLDASPGEAGGFKEIILSITGEGAYHALQFESGGHRVQRVPATETQGRIHTSAATVAVLPEAQEVDIEINDKDLIIETMRAGGPGGQKVNKIESAVRITHVPTGIAVKCQDEKSQHKNRAKAMRVLRSRMLEAEQSKQHQARADARRTLIGSGDRSEKIRTYNFPQSRVTDHRIGFTSHKLTAILGGEVNEIVQALIEFDRQERLKGAGSNS